MHRINVYMHYFFVPNRIIYTEWEEFITGGEDGAAAPAFPQYTFSNSNSTYYQDGSLADYLGLPTMDTIPVALSKKISALPFRAYTEIWNEYYRDQNLQERADYDKSGTVTTNDLQLTTVLRKRAWQHDYLTSCLPWAQKGNSVNVPLTDPNFTSKAYEADGTEYPSGNTLTTSVEGSIIGDTTGTGMYIDTNQGIDINELRASVRLQEWLEKNARAGSRYVESILAHFGINLGDYRAQRPIYLGGNKNPVKISEVLQTSATIVDGGEPHTNLPPSPQGNMAGHGISGGVNGFKYKFREHGYVFGIMSVLPMTNYQQAMPKLWNRFDKFDYFWPEFANLGEQEVLSSEAYIGADSTTENVEETFGYQSRYAEYKYRQSEVSSDMKNSLNFWHMGRIFDNQPVLNEEFIQADPTERIFPVQDGTNKLYVQVYNNVKSVRPMPKFGTPRL